MNSECIICFEIVRSSETQKPFATRCGHLFHENCIKGCLQNQSYGKCPQCNQSIMTSQLIRLFVNEPENSIKAKDELIEHLRGQLNELNEKAQLQYDLIGALNRQISLEKELSLKDKFTAPSQPSVISTSRLVSAPNRSAVCSNLSDFARVVLQEECQPGSTVPVNSNKYFDFPTGPVSTFGSTAPVPTATFGPAAPMSQAAFGSSNVTGNKNGNSTSTCGDTNTTELENQLGACALSVPKSNSTGSTSRNPFTKEYTFGSSTTFDNPTDFRFMLKDCSPHITSKLFDRRDEATALAPTTKFPIASSSQHKMVFAPTAEAKIQTASTSEKINLFAPTTTTAKTSKHLSKYKSPSSAAHCSKKSFTAKSSSNGFLDKWRMPADFSPSSNVSTDNATFNSSAGAFTKSTGPLQEFFDSLIKSSTLGGSAANEQVVRAEPASKAVKLEKVSLKKEDSQSS